MASCCNHHWASALASDSQSTLGIGPEMAVTVLSGRAMAAETLASNGGRRRSHPERHSVA